VKESFSAAAASGGDATAGGTSPTTALLSPEHNPDETPEVTNPEMYDVTPDVQSDNDDVTYTASITITHEVPGESELPTAEFDAKQVAHSIIKNKMGNMVRPDTPGRLFNRSTAGKAVVAGLESPESKREAAVKAARVKEILGSV
jgi:hypothetical protein